MAPQTPRAMLAHIATHHSMIHVVGPELNGRRVSDQCMYTIHEISLTFPIRSLEAYLLSMISLENGSYAGPQTYDCLIENENLCLASCPTPQSSHTFNELIKTRLVLLPPSSRGYRLTKHSTIQYRCFTNLNCLEWLHTQWVSGLDPERKEQSILLVWEESRKYVPNRQPV